MAARFLDRLASLPIIFISGACEAQMVLIPCNLPMPEMAPIHFASHPIKRVRHVAHRGAHRRTPHSFRLVTAGALCPVFLGEGLTHGNLGDDFDHAFGGDSLEGEGYGTDLGGEESGGGFGGGGGGEGAGGSDVAPIFLVDTPPLGAPALPIIPPPDCCGPTPTPLPTPVPEPSTWILMLAWFAALGFLRWRRA